MEYNGKPICPKCSSLYDKSLHIPLILPNCNHSICSKCICEMIIKNNNCIVCPIDKKVNKEIKSLKNLQINKNLIGAFETTNKKVNKEKNSNIPKLEEVSLGKEIISKSVNLKIDNNYFLNQNNNNNSNTFSSTFLNLKNKIENNTICSLHLLPNNIICINDRVKICSQCLKNNNLHINHEILTEDELLEQIEKLIDKYQEIEKINLNFNKIMDNNSENEISKIIDEKIEKLKESVNLTKNEIINNINIQIEQIIYYLDFRKNEIKNKINSNFNEITKLKEDIFNWKKITCNKLDKLNEINNISIECFKLLDHDPNNNLQNLFQKGTLLNDYYKKFNETMDNLTKFSNKGINIISNNELIEKIKFTYTKKKNNKNNYIVNTKLFNIIENEILINDLNLIKFHFEYGNRQSLNKSFGNKNNNEIKVKDEKNKEINEKLNPIITFKQNYNNNIFNNFNSYNYNCQNAISPRINKKINFNINIKSKSPNNKNKNKNIRNNNTIKEEYSNKKNENYQKVHYYKINPTKSSNFRNKKNQGKKVTNEPLNNINHYTLSSARNKKNLTTNKKESISNEKSNTYIYKNSFNVSNNKKLNEFDGSKLSKIINPIENISYQDSFNNISNLNYLTSIFDKNSNTNKNLDDMSNKKSKIDIENSFLNFSKINTSKENLNLKLKNEELNNLIINQLKTQSPNFNGNNMNGNGMILFCKLMKTMENIKINELLMEHCNLNDDDINLLIKILIEKNVNLEMLDLSWNEITDQSALYILDLIKENKSLNILLINNNSFSSTLKKKLESYVNLGREGLPNIKLCI